MLKGLQRDAFCFTCGASFQVQKSWKQNVAEVATLLLEFELQILMSYTPLANIDLYRLDRIVFSGAKSSTIELCL